MAKTVTFLDSRYELYILPEARNKMELYCDLSDGEIGYCCLYAMGLKGKDISAYMGNGHYKLSSAIRKKFGLSEHDTNLDIFLREILAETIN